jgi:hypothetical protein
MRTAVLLSLLLSINCGGDNKGPGGQADAAPGADSGIDAPDDAPRIADVNYPVIAHGGALVITGDNLGGATQVDIGGVAHTALSDVTDTSLVVDAVLDAAPTGAAQELTVTTPEGTSAPFSIAVIHLVISEVDVDSSRPNDDTRDFIELSTGVEEALSLDGYVLVLYQGGVAGVPVEQLFDLDTTTADTGLMLIGPSALVSPPQIVFEEAIQNGEDAIAIYQFPAAPNTFPASLAEAGTTGLIDALVYDSNGDGAVAAALAELISDTIEADEGPTSAARDTVSIQRCPADLTRRLGASYRLEVPTPGRANVNCDGVAALADCTIDFDAACPNTAAGECGAIFVGAGVCEAPGDAACADADDAYHASAADNRVDIFLTGELDTLDVFLAPLAGDATLRFFALDGTELAATPPVTASGDCTAGNTITSTLGAGAVRRIQVESDTDVFIDSFRTNP